VETRQNDGATTSTLRRAVAAGDAIFDAVFFTMRESSAIVGGGNLANMFNFDYLDFEKPWWDHNAVRQLSIDNRLYIVNSDIAFTSNMGAQALIFNKKLLQEHQLDDPYELVLSGKWTLENFGRMTRDVSRDLNGDGIMDEHDQWGLIFQRDSMSSFTNGSGVYIAQKDENDLPVLTMMGDKQIEVFGRIFDVLYDQSAAINVHREYEGRSGADWDVTMQRMFQNDQALFMWIRMRDVEALRAMDTDFGILPNPKFDEVQERYMTSINPYFSTIMGIPATNTEYDRTGIILEALAAESHYTVMPAYYDITLKHKIGRDEESADMLDIIFGDSAYDLGDIFLFGGLDSYIYETMQLRRDIASFFERREERANRDIDRLVERVMALD
jgi:ABC-type glycerol-3-phosphate transport system substrate-binding protein